MTERWWRERGFQTQEDLRAHIADIIACTPEGVPIVIYHDLLLWFFSHHERWEQKRGVGVRWFVTNMNANEFKTSKGFVVVRVDGTRESISYRTTLQHSTAMSRVKAAARVEI